VTKLTPVVRLAYSVAEAAQALSLSIVTIRRALDHNLIRGNKTGRVIRIPAAEVERVAAEGLPAIPHTYLRKTTGPTTRGRPPKAMPQSRPASKAKPRRKARAGVDDHASP
jgi:excisionase family DNA binding protein